MYGRALRHNIARKLLQERIKRRIVMGEAEFEADRRRAEENEQRLNEAGYTRAPGHKQWDPEGTRPPPDPVTESLRADLLQRQRVGWTKYGVGLGRSDFTMLDWLHHLEEELMDALQYTRRLRMTLKGELVVQGPAENVKIENELPAQEIARLNTEIAERHSRIMQLVGFDPRKRYTSVMAEVAASPAAAELRESMKRD